MTGSCYFYATRNDLKSVLDFIFSSTDLKVFEAYSRIGHPIRCFESVAQLQDESPDQDNHGTIHLQAHSQQIFPGKIVNEIKLLPSVGGGVRQSIYSPAAIQILEASPIKNAAGTFMDSSRVACFSEAGARQRSSYPTTSLDLVDWRLLAATFGKIERHIRRNLAVSRWAGRAVLEDAERERISGNIKLWPHA